MSTEARRHPHRFTPLASWSWLVGAALAAVHTTPAAEFTIPDGDVAALKQAITTSNTNGENDVIRLAANGTYTLVAVDNGINGLPIITTDGLFGVVIEGGGATIERDATAADFRLIEAEGESLTLNDLTLRNGRAFVGNGNDEEGGAIYNEGETLNINRCRFENNAALTFGGAISHDSSADLLTLTDCGFIGNTVVEEGGALFQNSPAVLVNVTFTGNSVTSTVPEEAKGGAIYANDDLTLTNCDFVENTSGYFGGAIAADFADVTMTDCDFTRNSGLLGGAIYNDGEVIWNGGRADENTSPSTLRGGGAIYNDDVLVITGVTFAGNTSSGHGGAILTDFGETEVTDVTFTGNRSIQDGGAMANFEGEIVVRDCLFEGNLAQPGGFGGGGAIDFNPDSSGRIFTSTFTGNSANGGGAIQSQGQVQIRDSQFSRNIANATSGGAVLNLQQMVITRCAFAANEATATGNVGNGGAIANFEGNQTNHGLSVTDCELTGNVAAERGGGIFNNSKGSLRVERCTLVDNRSTGTGPASGGGGFHDGFNGIVDIRNCTFVGNSAVRKGGGLYFGFGAERVVDSCTIVGNASSGTNAGDGGGGIINAASGTVEVGNSIVADNTAAAGGPDLHGTITSLGYNLFGTTAGSTVAGITTGQITGVAPALMPLAQNSGLVRTMLPATGSPVIDAGRQDTSGTLLTNDARGFSRPRDLASAANAVGGDGTDIGAVEIPPSDTPQSGAALTVNATDGAFDGVAGVAHTSLPDAFFTATASGSPAVIRFDPGVFPPLTPQTISLTSTIVVSSGTIRIEGPGKDLLTVERANLAGIADFPVFIFEDGADITIEGITIARGVAIDPAGTGFPGGGGIRNEGTLLLKSCALTDNAGLTGGGLHNAGSLTALDCMFMNNTVTSAIRNGRGGGLYQALGGTALVIGSTFSGNTAVQFNNRPGFGGAVDNFGGSLSLIDCTFFQNSATRSGAIDSSRPALITGCVFEENEAEIVQGAANFGSGVVVSDTRFTRNISPNGAGAARVSAGVIFRRCLFEENSAGREGGALDVVGPVTIENCTFTGNSADPTSNLGRGGAIHIDYRNGPPTLITHSTIQGNTAHTGGGIDLEQGSVEAGHTILANNTATTTGNDMSGDGVSLGYCLQKDTTGGGLVGGTGNLFGVDPQLLPLADNGSLNGLATHALDAASPALDAGAPAFTGPPFSDQRGLARTVGAGIDLGAHENSIPFQTYPDYEAATFPPGTPPALIAPGGDFDRDGVVNALEKLMNSGATDPADGPGLLKVDVDPEFLILRLPLARDFPPADAGAEHGDDLQQWLRTGVTWEIVAPRDAATDLVEIRIPRRVPAGPYFGRLYFP